MNIRWQGCVSSPFSVGNGVRQGGILSPFLVRFYVRNIISAITGLGYGCNVGDTFINMPMTWFFWLHLGCSPVYVKYIRSYS